MIRVLVGEDELLVRAGICSLLAGGPGLEVVGQAGDMDGVLAAARAHRPDVVVADARMPPGRCDEGVAIAAALERELPGTAVVLLSRHLDASALQRLFRTRTRGRGYLLTGRLCDGGQLVRAVREVAAGGSVVDPALIDGAAAAGAGPGASSLEALTAREREVLGLVATGLSNGSIASMLSLTKRAVEKHINGIFAKLDLHDDGAVSRRVVAALMYLGGPVGAPR
jgi:DNA-binding NarL/FixJ family response regulator